ncbi:MAG TPA: hypothetical protein VFR77_10000 [Steroidobacteraceae bacterium]|nr:hypothetical protein [Steroidobacteraceae bacterium]
MNTIPFGPRNPEDALIAKAAELPKEIEPARDLWPGIAARLGEAPRSAEPRGFRWPMALAAGVVVASVSALLTWSLMRSPDPVTPTTIAGTTSQVAEIVPVNYGPNSGLTAQELKARDELVVRFRETFATLRPETRDAIVKNLAIMQTAADEIDAALAKDPASRMLKGMLVGTYKQELQLYSTVVTSSDGLTRRT